MPVKYSVAILIILLIAVQPAIPQTAAEEDPFSESLAYAVEVQLIQIAVRVTDSEGNWVEGLTREDFELREDGITQEIRYLDEIFTRKLAPIQESRLKQDRKEFIISTLLPNSILVIFDGNNSGKMGIEKHKKYVRDFIQNFDNPNTIFCLITIQPNGSYEIVQNFTTNKKLLLEGMEKISGSMAGYEDRLFKAGQISNSDQLQQCTTRRGYSRNECIDRALMNIVAKATQYAAEEENKVKNTIRSLKEIFGFAEHIPGQKSVLLISEGLDPVGGFYFNYAANVIRYFADHYGLPPAALNIIRNIQEEANRSIDRIAEIRNLIKSANGAGVAVFWANPEYGKAITEVSSETGVTTSMNLKLINAPDIDSTMRGLAEDTGGAYLTSSDPNGFYQKIIKTIPSYYLISYKPARPLNDGRFHRIEVLTRNKNLKVTYAKDYKDLKLSERIRNQLAAAHDFPGVSTQIPLHSELTAFKTSSGDYRVMIRAGISYQHIDPQVFLDRVNDDIHFSFLVRNAEQKVLNDKHPIIKIRSPLSEFQALQQSKAILEYSQEYTLKPGIYRFQMAAMDVIGWKTASDTKVVKLPGQGESCLSVSPIMLASSISKAETTAKSPTPTQKGDIHYGDQLFSFSVARIFPPNGNLTGFYQIYNAHADANTSNPSVFVAFKLYHDKNIFVNQTPEREITAYTDPFQNLISNFFSVPYNNLNPGSYELEIFARDSLSGCTSSSRVKFEVALPPVSPASE